MKDGKTILKKGALKIETSGKKSGVEGLVMAAFKFTEKDRINFDKALKKLTKASASAATAMINFGIVAEKIKAKNSLEAKP